VNRNPRPEARHRARFRKSTASPAVGGREVGRAWRAARQASYRPSRVRAWRGRNSQSAASLLTNTDQALPSHRRRQGIARAAVHRLTEGPSRCGGLPARWRDRPEITNRPLGTHKRTKLERSEPTIEVDQVLAACGSVLPPATRMTANTCLPTPTCHGAEPCRSPELAEIHQFSADSFSFCPPVLQKCAVRYFWPCCKTAPKGKRRPECAAFGVRSIQRAAKRAIFDKSCDDPKFWTSDKFKGTAALKRKVNPDAGSHRAQGKHSVVGKSPAIHGVDG
jgi:hypothetical protein